MGNLIHKQSKYVGNSARPERPPAVAPEAPLHSGAILGLACISDSAVVSCSDDKTLALYDQKKHRADIYFKGHTKAVNRVVANGVQLFSCSRDLSIKIWNTSSSECLGTYDNAHTLNVAGISYSSVNNQLASGSRDYHVKTWDVETGVCVNDYTSPRNIVTCLQYDPTGNLLYQGSEDLCVRVWDIRSSGNQPAIHITGYVYFPLSLSVSPTDGGVYVATGCKGFNSVGCTVKLFDIRQLKHSVISDMAGHAHDVNACQFFNNSRQLLSASKDGTVRMWDTLVGKECCRYSSDDNLQYTSIGFYQGPDRCTKQFFASSFSGVLSELSVRGTDESLTISCDFATIPCVN